MRNTWILAFAACLVVGLTACGPGGGGGEQRQAPGEDTGAPSATQPGASPSTMGAAPDEAAEAVAMAVIEPTQGGNVHGTVEFRAQGDGVLVIARLEGLSEGEHGFHVHEFGDCSAPDASSAGGHFAPLDAPHGPPEAQQGQRHVGDLGNIQAGPDGSATYERLDTLIELTGDRSIVGKAIVVHADKDDLQTQPSGNAGGRVGCGVVALGSSQGSDATGG